MEHVRPRRLNVTASRLICKSKAKRGSESELVDAMQRDRNGKPRQRERDSGGEAVKARWSAAVTKPGKEQEQHEEQGQHQRNSKEQDLDQTN